MFSRVLRLAVPAARVSSNRLYAQPVLIKSVFANSKLIAQSSLRFASTKSATNETASGRKKASTKKAVSKAKKTASGRKAAPEKKPKKKVAKQVKINRFEPVSGLKAYANSILKELREQKFTSQSALSKYLSSQYSSLSSEEKQKYVKEASQFKNKLKRKEERKQLPPHYTGYILYIKDNSSSFKDGKVVEAVRKLAENWRNLAENDKKAYNDRAAQLSKEYYAKKAELEKEKPKRPVNKYALFNKERFSKIANDNPDLGFGEVTKIVAKEWSQKTAEEKEAYGS